MDDVSMLADMAVGRLLLLTPACCQKNGKGKGKGARQDQLIQLLLH
jgi:hypothetical protein